MKLSGLYSRVEPVILKALGKLPLCPWSVILSRLNPRTVNVYPPEKQIEFIKHDGDFVQLRFNGVHEAWFPAAVEISPEMWSEYLGVFWAHRANAHFYLAHGTPIRSGDVCLDCGSCEGFFAHQALEGGASKVICVEPNPEMARCLQRTFNAEIEAGRVIVWIGAVGAAPGTARFSATALDPFGGATAKVADANQAVEVGTIAEICEKLALPRIDLIKMDIEGAELQAVEGAIPILRRDHPRLAITTYHRSFHYAALRSLLRAAGYPHIRASGSTDRNGGTIRPVMLHAWS